MSAGGIELVSAGDMAIRRASFNNLEMSICLLSDKWQRETLAVRQSR